MRDDWQWVALGQIATQEIEPFDVDPEGQYVNLGVQWYAQGVFARPPKRGSEMRATRLFRVRPGQFIYNRMFVTEGSFGVVRDEHAAGVVSNEFPVFVIDSGRMLTEFLALYFQQPHVWERAANEATGTTKSRRRWKESQFLAHLVAVPSLDEQRRIVDIIAAVDHAILTAEVEARALDVTVDRLRQLTPSAELRPLGRLLSSIDSGVSLATLPGEAEGARLLRVSAVQHSQFKPDEHKRVGDAALPDRARVQTGDILMTRSNTPDRVGFVARVDDVGDDVYIPDLIWRLVPDRDQVSPEYLVQVLSSPYGRKEITSRASGTSASMQKISKARVSTIEIPVPSIADQLTYLAPIESAQRAKASVAATAASLRTMRSVLLTVLLSGDHQIPTSYDALLQEVAA